jgi:glutamate racemase
MPKFFDQSKKDSEDYKKYMQFKNMLAVKRGKLTEPPAWKIAEPGENNYPPETRQFIAKLEKIIEPNEIARMENPSKEDLLHALDIIAKAEKIIIFVGKNTASGHVQPDAPAAAALISNALIRINKVPVIVSDEKNARMIKCIADKAPILSGSTINEVNEVNDRNAVTGLKIGKYLQCHYIEAVNGILVSDLARLIEEHKPDAAMFIGIPGSQSGKDECFDDHERHIDDFNVAFDKALELCHFHEIHTVAICSSKNDVGMGGVAWKGKIPDGKGKDGHAQQAATCTVFSQQLSTGAIALAELATRSHNKDSVPSDHVKELAELANAKSERGIFVSAYRQHPRFWQPGMSKVSASPIDTSYLLEKLNVIAESFSKSPLDWPLRLQHFRDYGAPVQHLVLYDSSDGAFIAANDYLSFLKVNSNFDYKITIVTDHAKAPYGQLGEELFCVVVKGVHYSALQTPDAIVMVCNSACSKSLEEARKIVEEILRRSGIEKKVEVIDLIETTAKAIIKKGGARPAILCTEITAKNKAYENAIEIFNGKPPRKKINPCVIGCGNTQYNEIVKKKLDWASIVNRLDHLSTDPVIKAEVRKEIDKYVEEIPEDATAIFLACTHFPALLEILRESVRERFTRLGRADSIPEIIDPIKYQALETIKRMKNTKGRDDLNTGIEVHTSEFKKFGDVKKSLLEHTKHMDVEALVGARRNFRSGEVESGDEDEYGRSGTARGQSGFGTPNGIVLKQVKFDEVDNIEELARKVGVDTKGNRIRVSRAAAEPCAMANENERAPVED